MQCQVYNKETNSNPIIIHGSTSSYRADSWGRIQNTIKSFPIPIEPQEYSYTVVTWSNYETKSCLEKSLGDIECVKLGVNIKDWHNIYKIPLLIEFLKRCKSKYIIALDCNDVVIAGSLNTAIKRFINMECSVLFNGDAGRWPSISTQNKYGVNIGVGLEESSNRRFKYINSGGVIGEREAILKVYEVAMQCPGLRFGDDQLMIRWAYQRMHHIMGIDRECRIFQIYRDRKTLVQINDNKIVFDRKET